MYYFPSANGTLALTSDIDVTAAGNNTFSGTNTFDNLVEIGGTGRPGSPGQGNCKLRVSFGLGSTGLPYSDYGPTAISYKYPSSSTPHILAFPQKSGTFALTSDIPEAKLNENIIKNPDKTYLVWKGSQFPNSTDAIFKAPARCTIDWGDGNVETFGTASTVVNTHNYTDGIEYHLISLSNYTAFSNNAFSGCTGLTSVTIGNNVISIGNYVFGSCTDLTSVTIGNGVTSIDNFAFSACNKLKIIRMSATNPPTLKSRVFETSIEKIIVPKSAINAYKSAPGWSTYADKIVYEVDSSDLGSVEVDNRTITKTSNEEIQAVALTNGTDLLTYAEILQATTIERL